MAMAEKANEPTMDEILASIRKIIAEEPVGKQASTGSISGSDGGADQKIQAPRASLDDILGMADVPSREPASKGHAAGAKAADALPLPAPVTKASEAGGQAKAATEPSRPFFPAPAGSKLSDKAVANRTPSGSAASASKAEAARAPDFDAIVPSKPVGAAGGAEESERRPLAGRLPEWLSRPGTSAPSPNGPAPMPVETKSAPSVVPASHQDRKSDVDTKLIEADLPTEIVTAPNASRPTAAVPPTSTAGMRSAASAGSEMTPFASRTADAKPAAPAGSVKAAAPAAAPEAKPAATSTGSASMGTSGSESKSASAAAGRSAVEDAGARAKEESQPKSSGSGLFDAKPASSPSPAATEKPAMVPVPVAEPLPSLAKPAMLDRSKAVKSSSGSELVASVPPVGGIRSLDDTIIELLRPMIRQWLDDNMPRMVEQALRIELAASLQAKGIPQTKTDSSKH